MSLAKEYGYDEVSLAYGSLADIQANKDKLNTYEPVISTDTKAIYYKDENGDLINFANDKLSKGAYDGTAEDLKTDIEQNKSDILLKMDSINPIIKGGVMTFDNEKTVIWKGNDGELILKSDYDKLFHNTNGGYHKIWSNGNNTISKQGSGWCKFANGLIVQWGTGSTYSESGFSKRVISNFPVSFTGDYRVVCLEDLGTDYTAYQAKVTCGRNTMSSFFINYNCTLAPNQTTYTNNVSWIAIGY